MDRRGFLRAALSSTAAGVGARLWPASALAAPAKVVFEDSFKRGSTSNGWGQSWFNQHRGLPWGIAKKKGFIDLPVPQTGAGEHNPNPFLVIDKDVGDIDLKAKLTSNNEGARFGLIARMAGYSDFYAAYLDGSQLRISRFGIGDELELKATSFKVKAGASYFVRFVVKGTTRVTLQAKAWKAGAKEPSGFKVKATDGEGQIDDPGPFGVLAMHDVVGQKAARIGVSQLSARSAQKATKSKPGVTFAFAGIMTGTGPTRSVQLVAKSDIPGDITFHVGTDVNLSDFTEIAPGEANDKLQIAKKTLPGVVPGSTLFWRAEARSKSGKKRRTNVRAIPIPGPGDRVSFGFGSCTHCSPASNSFATAASLNPTFFTHLGDFGYPFEADRGAALDHTTGSYQDRWTRMFCRPSMLTLQEKAALIVIPDDHDLGADIAWSDTFRPFALDAFHEISGNDGQRFFDVRYGDVHCFWLDTHASANNPEVPDNPGHSLLGASQKDAFKSKLRSSDASLLVVFTPIPFWGGGLGRHNWKGAFALEGKELFDVFFEVQTPGRRLIICSGNAHAHQINRHSRPTSNKDVFEFISSGTDRYDNDTAAPVNANDGVIDPQRAVKHVDAFGFVSLDPAGPDRKVRIRAIESKTGQDVWPPLFIDL